MHTNAGYSDANCQLISGRVGIVMGLLTFAFVYMVMLQQFGWITGVALGWLPSGLAGWLTAVGSDTLVTGVLRSRLPQPASSQKS